MSTTTFDLDRDVRFEKLRKRIRALIGFTLVRILAPVVRRLTDQKYFYAFERYGVHVTPIHFYQPIPDTRMITAADSKPETDPPGIRFNASFQRQLIRRFAARYKNEYSQFLREKGDSPIEFFLENGAFGYVDAEILHCMVRHLRPRRIIEVGCGFSTLVIAGAIRASIKVNKRYTCSFTGIDPYPLAMLEEVSEVSNLIREPVQSVPLRVFEALKSGDILFIDSSHVLITGGDVRYELLEILPRLRKGVYVHFHDVFIPSDYPRSWQIEKAIFWNEQYAIQAFLEFNSTFKIVWASSYMSLRHPDELRTAFSSFDPDGPRPASLWLQRMI